MAEIILETPRLALRNWNEGDLDLWFDLLNTENVRRYLGGVEAREKIAERLEKARQGWLEDGYSFLALERREDGAFLGTCGVARIANDSAPQVLLGEIQIGWQLREDGWGKGYATEAARYVLDHFLARFEWPVVYAQTSENNRASWRVMEHLGMRRRTDLDYHDPAFPADCNPTMVWSIAREDRLAA